MENTIINLTPHDIVVVDDNLNEVTRIASSGNIARCKATPVNAGDLDGIPLTRTEYGEVEGLPEAQDGVYYIVSALVRTRLPERKDLLSPGRQVRDDAGRIVGCQSLDGNF